LNKSFLEKHQINSIIFAKESKYLKKRTINELEKKCFRKAKQMVMKILSLLILLTITATVAFAQPKTQDPAFEQDLQSKLSFSIPTISIKEFKKMLKNENIYILDAREKAEFDISHIQKGKLIGHKNVDKNALNGIPKNATIVVYCTVGVRSEQVGSRLQKMGYENVFNLLGGIVEWVNQGNDIVNNSNANTSKIHVYSPEYEKWLTSGLTAIK
jgi:rhodanese-related sulfurtransferase